MSGTSRSTEPTVDSLQNSCFGGVFSRFRRLFRRDPENSRLSVQAVDSVRLVYMRRILHNSISESTYSGPILYSSTPDYTTDGTISMSAETEAPLLRRRKSNRPTLEALELALKAYESKHKHILQHTAPPNEKYMSVESITSGYSRKYGLKPPARKSQVGFEFEIGKIENTSSQQSHLGRLTMEGERLKICIPTTITTDDEEEEKNVCFDVESASMASFQIELDTADKFKKRVVIEDRR